MAYQIVQYRPEHREALLQLRRRVFGGSRRQNENHFRWKYEANPYSREPLIYLAFDGSRLVGMRGMYGGLWLVPREEEPLPVRTAADTAVDPDHRGRNLFERIMRTAERDLRDRGDRFIFNFSANRATTLLSLRAGWKRASPFATYRRGAGTMASAGRDARSDPIPAWRKLAPLVRGQLRNRRFNRWERNQKLRQGVEEAPNPATLAAMSSSMSSGSGSILTHQRDEHYYRWRLAAPDRDYRLVSVRSAQGFEAFALLLVPRSIEPVRIVDWATCSLASWQSLIDRLPPAAICDLVLWTAGLGESSLNALVERDFHPVSNTDTRRRPAAGPLYRSLHGDEELPGSSRWMLRMLDSDAY